MSVKTNSKYRKLFVTGSNDTTVNIWNIVSRKIIRSLIGHDNGVHAVVFD